MNLFPLPDKIGNWISDKLLEARGGEWFNKRNPHTGSVICAAARSKAADVDHAVQIAINAQRTWAALPAVKRGEILFQLALLLEKHEKEFTQIIALETGKSPKDALGELRGAIALGRFYAGEGQRMYGRTTTSATPFRQALTIREPIGVAGLIIAANTPIANIAWKVFPALICGNSAVVKAAEDTPITAWAFAEICKEAGLPSGSLNIIQGFGEEAGAPLVNHESVDLISFTGSTEVGRLIAETAGKRMARLSLELGGKNPFIVCDDADVDLAVHWAVLSAFSNAGQRCAAASRLVIFDAVYQEFSEKLLQRTANLRVGPSDEDDFGPVINEEQLKTMLSAIEQVVSRGAKVLCGGHRLTQAKYQKGFYLAPTIIENVRSNDPFSRTELFGPITTLYRVKDFDAALEVANNSPYGLTAALHSKSIHRTQSFVRRIKAGVAVINAGTYGSEPHMPFGGVKQSGNGSREPGTEALDFYSNLKDVYIVDNPQQV